MAKVKLIPNELYEVGYKTDMYPNVHRYPACVLCKWGFKKGKWRFRILSNQRAINPADILFIEEYRND